MIIKKTLALRTNNMEGRVLILALHLQYNGNWDKIYRAITNKSEPHRKYLAKAKKVQYNYLTLLDKDYPQELKFQYKPPFVIANEKKGIHSNEKSRN